MSYPLGPPPACVAFHARPQLANEAMLQAHVHEGLILQAVQQAAGQGFKPRRDEPGRQGWGRVGAGRAARQRRAKSGHESA